MINSYPDLFWGYTAICVLFAGYIFSLGKRIHALEEQQNSDHEKEQKNTQTS
jgi:hypothetical protein